MTVVMVWAFSSCESEAVMQIICDFADVNVDSKKCVWGLTTPTSPTTVILMVTSSGSEKLLFGGTRFWENNSFSSCWYKDLRVGLVQFNAAVIPENTLFISI